MKTVMKSGNPIVETYRNYRIILHSKNESIREKVELFLEYVKEAVRLTALDQSVSVEVNVGS